MGDPYGSEWIYWYIREVSTAIITANLPLTWTFMQRVFRLGSFHAKYGKSSGQRTGEATNRLRSAYGNLSSRTREEPAARTRTGLNDIDISPSESQEQINGGYSIPLKIYQKNEVHITSEQIDVKDGRTSPNHTGTNGVTFTRDDVSTSSENGDKSTGDPELGVVTKVYHRV